jgi:hypothetical protein
VKSLKSKVILNISLKEFTSALMDTFKAFIRDYILILIRARSVIKVLKKLLFLIKKLKRLKVFNYY